MAQQESPLGPGTENNPITATLEEIKDNIRFANSISEIESQLSELDTAGGGKLIIGESNRDSNQIDVPSGYGGFSVPENTVITALGRRGTWFELQGDLSGPLFDLSTGAGQSFGAELHNIGIGGDSQYGGAPAVSLDDAALVRLSNIEVRDFRHTALSMNNTWDTKVVNCQLDNCGGSGTSPTIDISSDESTPTNSLVFFGTIVNKMNYRGVEIGDNVRAVRFNSCKFARTNNGDEGAYMNAPAAVKFIDCQFDSVDTLGSGVVQVDGAVSGLTIANSTFSGTAPTSWIRINGDGDAISVINSEFGIEKTRGAIFQGIQITNGSNIQLSNISMDNHGEGQRAIQIAANDVTLNQVYVENAEDEGIFAAGSDVTLNSCHTLNCNQGGGTEAGIAVNSAGAVVANCSSSDDQGSPTQNYGFEVIADDTRLENISGGGNATGLVLDGGSRTRINGVAEEALGGSAPGTPSNWDTGDIVEDSDTAGDAYLKLPGGTFTQIGD